jgi:hypothetical protein
LYGDSIMAFPNGTVAYNLTSVTRSFLDAAPVLAEEDQRIFVQAGDEIVTFRILKGDGQNVTALTSLTIPQNSFNPNGGLYDLAYDSVKKNLYYQTSTPSNSVYRIEPPYDTFPGDPLFTFDTMIESRELVIDSIRRVGYSYAVDSTPLDLNLTVEYGIYSFPLDSKNTLSPVRVLDLPGFVQAFSIDTKTGNLYFLIFNDVYEALYKYENTFYPPTIIYNNVINAQLLTFVGLQVQQECPDDDDDYDDNKGKKGGASIGKKGGNDDENSDDDKGKKGGNDDKNGDDNKGKKDGNDDVNRADDKGKKDGDDDENGDAGKGSPKESKNSKKYSEHRTSVRRSRVDEEGLGVYK